MSLWSNLFPPAAPPPASLPAPEPPAQAIVLAAKPLVVGSGQDPVKYALYRLDAIRRHLEVRPSVTEKWCDEALTETLSLTAALKKEQAITHADFIAAIARVWPKGVPMQFVAGGN